MSRKLFALLVLTVTLAVTSPAPLSAQSPNPVYTNSGLGLRFLLPRDVPQVLVDQLDPNSAANFSMFSDAILLQTWEDVDREGTALILGLYAGEGAHLLAANYPRDAFPREANALYDTIMSSFALTDHLLGATARLDSREVVDVEVQGSVATVVYQRYIIVSQQIEIWTVVVPHDMGTLLLRFGALASAEYPEWMDFEEEVTRTINSIRVNESGGLNLAWIPYILGLVIVFFIARRVLDTWQVRSEVEKEEEYEAELEQAFGRTYSTTRTPNWTESFPVTNHPTSEFSFPPRIQKALEEHDIYTALELAEELLQMAQEMQDLQAESSYRESIIRLKGMAATGAD